MSHICTRQGRIKVASGSEYVCVNHALANRMITVCHPSRKQYLIMP